MDSASEAEADRRVEQAKASMFARMEELGRRVQDARRMFDVKAHITAHPAAAVGIAVAVGGLLGMLGGRKHSPVPADSDEVKAGMMGALLATAGSLVVGLLKTAAMREFADVAKDWWDRRQSADGGVGATEAGASRAPDVESFLGH